MSPKIHTFLRNALFLVGGISLLLCLLMVFLGNGLKHMEGEQLLYFIPLAILSFLSVIYAAFTPPAKPEKEED